MNASAEHAKPSSVANCSGRCEKLVIASKLKRSIRAACTSSRPALRASRWNVTAVCVKPTQTLIPRRKRLRSGIASSASSGARSISRKSPDSGVRSMSRERAEELGRTSARSCA